MSGNDDVEAILREDVSDSVDFHDTTDPEEVFYTTNEKLELALRNYDNVLKSKYRGLNAFVIFITAFSVFLVADFEHTLGISPKFWSTLFLVISILSLLFCVRDGLIWYLNRENEDKGAVMKELRKNTSEED